MTTKGKKYISDDRLAAIVRQAEARANAAAYEKLAEIVDRRVWAALRRGEKHAGEAIQLVQVLDHMGDVLGQSIPF